MDTEGFFVRSELVPVGRFALEALRTDGAGWLVVKPVCEQLGIGYEAQRQKLSKAPWAVTCFIQATGSDGKIYSMFCLRSDRVGMWLATLDTGRIRDAEVKATIGELQIKASEALDRWLRGESTAAIQAGNPIITALEQALAIAKRQDEQERRLTMVEALHNSQAAAVRQLEASHQAAVASLQTFPVPATPELPTISHRKAMNRIVRAHCIAYRLAFNDIWNASYTEARYRFGIDIKARAAVRKCTPMDVVEQDGLSEKMLAIVKYVCREPETMASRSAGHA